jgi:hypothetical protein
MFQLKKKIYEAIVYPWEPFGVVLLLWQNCIRMIEER